MNNNNFDFFEWIENVIIAIYVWWDDEVAKPFRRWRLATTIDREVHDLVQRRDLNIHWVSNPFRWMLILTCIFLFKRFFSEELAELPGIGWFLSFIVGLIDMLFEFCHTGLKALFRDGPWFTPKESVNLVKEVWELITSSLDQLI